jgi:hypothetical protein
MQAFASSMTVDTERRKKHRNRPRSLVYVELESANGGMMRDLSEEGFALRTTMPLRAGGKTQFAFSLAQGTRISGEGRIVWIKEDGRVAGIEFCGISRSAREQIRRWLDRADQPAGREPKVPAIAVPEPSTLETLREEGRRALPRVVLPSVEGAKTAPLPEPDIAAIALPQLAEISELTETPTESATPPDPIAQAGLHDISPETAPVAVLEPPATESLIEPLPELQPEIEYNEGVDSHPASRSPLTRAIGMMLLLALIAAGVVYHHQVGHALIWLGQIIAGPEGTRVPQSSVAEPPAQATPVPETTVPASSPAFSDGSATSTPQGDRAAPSETQPVATRKAIEAPPILPATPSSSTKTPSAPVIHPAPQQERIPEPGSSSGTAGDTGQQAYQQAEQILRNRSSQAELAVAVRLLWVAVEKGNGEAEVALAELYRQGKGAAKNCDQARILLSAAARKGSAEARKRLEEFMRNGCR